MTHFYLKYVPIKKIPEWESLGWRVRDKNDPCHHCFYAKIMKWEGNGEPVFPNENKDPGGTRPND